MKISEIITDKYKLRIPPTVYYDLLADVREVEEEQEPKIGHWKGVNYRAYKALCSNCGTWSPIMGNYCPYCGAKIESEEV